ncbi:NADH dehydrogenase subunit [Vararia minispora EC-137]|uniref:NADH dehydrogenase subunit n=1 Tax=Vararia minispora EC-137 TaxID=1314806 RepID=A0ACB8QKH3_9AGAM|nr:NADH dehydrogenase subunit [Vararia minispora EC-137]
MATKLAADHTLYHVSPKGFWKKLHETVALNPNISTGLPLPAVNRNPQPGSRPEKYSTPATKASDPAQNPYWKRDVRRSYPQLSVVTQSGLSKLLIQHSPAFACVIRLLICLLSVAPPAEGAGASTSIPATTEAPSELAKTIQTLASKGTKPFSASNLPPQPPSAFTRWVPERTPDAPHDPHAYFPMILVK